MSTQIFEEIKNVFVFQSNYLLLSEIKLSEARNMLETWLYESKRNLSNNQWHLVDAVVNKSKRTLLLLRLLFSIISKWSSFYKVETQFLMCVNSNNCFEYILNNIEKKYDRLIFSRCMFYLTVSQFGIQDCEMEGILNVDREIRLLLKLNDQSSFPIGIWTTIRNDLADFLTIKQFDNVQIIDW